MVKKGRSTEGVGHCEEAGLMIQEAGQDILHLADSLIQSDIHKCSVSLQINASILLSNTI